ncbi:glycosyltransferase 87 family protein [Amycolatopsis sp. NPDC058278]|uniref:glycosyltransferase 87 family protein n=1 Tax=Amycolatopsis sp. NPDC058278 TaxID=3346417 RepID=UPI0036DA11A9
MRKGKVGLAVLFGGIAAGLIAITIHHLSRGLPLGTDSAVYRAGGLALLHGEPLYDPLLALAPPDRAALPFTYPPFAALLFVLLAVVPPQIAWLFVAMGSVPALMAVVHRFAGSLPPVVLCLLPVLEPVWRLLSLGQINAVLMALVVTDVLPARRPRWGGVLVGLAAAVKLTPLIFVPHLFLTGRRADGVRALAVFCGASALGAVVLPRDSLRYWTSAVVDNHNAGSIDWVLDQSLHGLLARSGMPSIGWYAAGTALILAVAAVLVRDFHRRGDARAALLVSAGCALLISPLSWTHHWIWAVPLAACLAGRRAALAGVAAVFTGRTLTWVPEGAHRELTWNLPQALLGNAYVLAALAAGAVLGLRLSRRGRIPRRPDPGDQGNTPHLYGEGALPAR